MSIFAATSAATLAASACHVRADIGNYRPDRKPSVAFSRLQKQGIIYADKKEIETSIATTDRHQPAGERSVSSVDRELW